MSSLFLFFLCFSGTFLEDNQVGTLVDENEQNGGTLIRGKSFSFVSNLLTFLLYSGSNNEPFYCRAR